MPPAAKREPSRLYRLLRGIHLWLTLTLAVPIVVVSVTGAILVFGQELESLFDPGANRVTPGAQTLSHGTILARVAEQKPDVRVWSLSSAERPDRAWTIWLAGGGGVIKVDPYRGTILKHFRPRDTFDGWVAALHRRWLVDGKWGRVARNSVGVVTLAVMIQVILGLWVWLVPPQRVQRLAVRRGQPARVLVLRLHNLAGVVTAGFLLLIAFTGLTMTWHAPTRAVVEALAASRVTGEGPPRFDDLAPIADLDAAIATGTDAVPGGRLQGVRPPAKPGAPAVLHIDVPDRLIGAQVWVGGQPPRVLAVRDGRGTTAADWFWRLRYRFHVGNFGWPAQVLWMVMSLMPVAFVGTGLWLYWRRRRDRRAAPAAAE
jgi:uncharacterized iron-regulated membrane protein